MAQNNLIKNILSDIKVKLTEEFDRNFERKAFFDRPWSANKLHNPRGSMMMRSGALRKSIRSQISGSRLRFSSSEPYASLHNTGGKITVTAKMKKFFWAMYLQTKQEQYKAMALKKPGEQITIPQRQFIGNHPKVEYTLYTRGRLLCLPAN